ncbi:4'-phosphopantetheinyl transferase superfamily protein [Streptomyces sp. NPDC005790]|uniref:4'-phosphopantetheinyl transferase family protein n=1 Tax=Streptomyces sp. NPDC005790 TaxID=3154777 RepID=UPI0033D66808
MPRSPAARRGADTPDFAVSPNRLDLWLLRSPGGAAADMLDRSELDPAERLRAAAFRRPADGLLYAAAHVALRRLLARYTGVPPQALRFVREPCPGCGAAHGRPAVDHGTPHFSLSHSGGLALVAVAARPVGADVQALPREETVELCASSLHPCERAELDAAHGPDRRVLFGRIWTRKEAYLKGLGTGLSRSPGMDYLGADTGRHPDGWAVLDVPCPATHTAAAVVRGSAPAVVRVRGLGGDWLRARGGGGDRVRGRSRTRPAQGR